MNVHVGYFRSQKYTADEQITQEYAVSSGNYVRAIFDYRNEPEKAEIFNDGQLRAVVYYGRDPQDANFVRKHFQEYGAVSMTVYGLPALTQEGELQTLRQWTPAGELAQTIKRLVNERGEPLREELFDRSGSPTGVRVFEYIGGDLVRIVFNRSDGVEIVELED